MAELGPRLETIETPETKATAVIGTVQYDVHDIGKDILIMMLRGVGFEVIDLGVDVPPEKFVDAIRRHNPSVVGMSVLLTTCFKSVLATADAIREAGLRDQITLMVGGAAASDLLRDNAGCDFYGKTAVDGMNCACQAAGVG
jgi:5-methyltetrahydrofolate--homocysteine methyltransferase